jgi:hypothetical protein
MARYGKESKLSPAKVLEKAFEFFGPGGLGLEVKDPGEDCATFEGGGGHVFLGLRERAWLGGRPGNPRVGLPGQTVHGEDLRSPRSSGTCSAPDAARRNEFRYYAV